MGVSATYSGGYLAFNVGEPIIGSQSGTLSVRGNNACGGGAISQLSVTVSTPKEMQLTLFLQGLYTGDGLMRQAHGASGAQFGTGIADRVTVKFYSSVAPYALVYEVNNIDLLTNGMLSINNLPCNISGSYYIAIRYRNSIETWSAQPFDFSGAGPYSYDFSTAASQAYGNNQIAVSGG